MIERGLRNTHGNGSGGKAAERIERGTWIGPVPVQSCIGRRRVSRFISHTRSAHCAAWELPAEFVPGGVSFHSGSSRVSFGHIDPACSRTVCGPSSSTAARNTSIIGA
jgi:hypothetical protein